MTTFQAMKAAADSWRDANAALTQAAEAYKQRAPEIVESIEQYYRYLDDKVPVALIPDEVVKRCDAAEREAADYQKTRDAMNLQRHNALVTALSAAGAHFGAKAFSSEGSFCFRVAKALLDVASWRKTQLDGLGDTPTVTGSVLALSESGPLSHSKHERPLPATANAYEHGPITTGIGIGFGYTAKQGRAFTADLYAEILMRTGRLNPDPELVDRLRIANQPNATHVRHLYERWVDNAHEPSLSAASPTM